MALKAFRFKYDQILEQCLDGTHRIAVTDPLEQGRHVRKIQQALLDEGLQLPEHGADGSYGPETAAAVSQFKQDQQISPSDGVVGPKTMETLDAIFSDEVPFPTPVIGPGEMSLDDFLEAIQAAEQANSADSVEEFITRVRQLYYPGTDPDGLTFREVAFDHLLPDAPFKMADGSRRLLTPAGMDPIFFGRLAMRAPENPTPGRPLDNPSPYFYDTAATRIDLGHLLLTVDTILHPRADVPYVDFGVPAIDPASWVADLGIAAVWAEQDGAPDAPKVLPRLPNGSADFDGYYLMSAPDADLFGDIDGINIGTILASSPLGTTLSSVLVRYYIDGDTQPGQYRQRFRLFLDSLVGSSTPDAATLSAGMVAFVPRIDRFNDLFSVGAVDAFLTLTPPPAKHWAFTDSAVAKFQQFLLDQVATETSRFD